MTTEDRFCIRAISVPRFFRANSDAHRYWRRFGSARWLARQSRSPGCSFLGQQWNSTYSALIHINPAGTEISSGGEFKRYQEFLLGDNGGGAYVATIPSLRPTREARNRESCVDLRRDVFDCYEGALGAKEPPVVLDSGCGPLSSSFALDFACPVDKQVDSGGRNSSDRNIGSCNYPWVYCSG